MIISTARKIPGPRELSQILKKELSSEYSYKIFGFGSGRSVIVQKSSLVGAQVTVRKDEIDVSGIFPSILTSFFFTLLGYISNYRSPPYTRSAWRTSWRNLENELADYLKCKYG
jgi:hypothetical protein